MPKVWFGKDGVRQDCDPDVSTTVGINRRGGNPNTQSELSASEIARLDNIEARLDLPDCNLNNVRMSLDHLLGLYPNNLRILEVCVIFAVRCSQTDVARDILRVIEERTQRLSDLQHRIRVLAQGVEVGPTTNDRLTRPLDENFLLRCLTGKPYPSKSE